jgi:hypothetical protein
MRSSVPLAARTNSGGRWCAGGLRCWQKAPIRCRRRIRRARRRARPGRGRLPDSQPAGRRGSAAGAPHKIVAAARRSSQWEWMSGEAKGRSWKAGCGPGACPTTEYLHHCGDEFKNQPPAGLPVWHARLRAPRRGRCGKPGGMLHRRLRHWLEKRAVGKGGQGRLESRPQASGGLPHVRRLPIKNSRRCSRRGKPTTGRTAGVARKTACSTGARQEFKHSAGRR